MTPRVRTSLNLHVEPGAEIEAHQRDCHEWVTLGHVGLWFDDDADVSRLIRELEVLRHRMRKRAHLPEAVDAALSGLMRRTSGARGEEAPDPVEVSLDREVAGVVR